MINHQEHLDNLVRHIDLVRNGCLLLGERLIKKGREEFGRILISKGFVHDASKFSGIEWDYLHAGNDVPRDMLMMAVKQHVTTNPHHPEYWGGVENMPEIYIYECVADFYARSHEFGTNLRDWVNKDAVQKFNIDTNSRQYDYMQQATELLLVDYFVR